MYIIKYITVMFIVAPDSTSPNLKYPLVCPLSVLKNLNTFYIKKVEQFKKTPENHRRP